MLILMHNIDVMHQECNMGESIISTCMGFPGKTKDNVRSVFEKSAHKLVSQSISNGRIRASNEYLQTVKGQQLDLFHDGSDTYLIEEQYAIVKHVGLNFIICLLCFYYF
jgi:hypothetical protein